MINNNTTTKWGRCNGNVHRNYQLLKKASFKEKSSVCGLVHEKCTRLKFSETVPLSNKMESCTNSLWCLLNATAKLCKMVSVFNILFQC